MKDRMNYMKKMNVIKQGVVYAILALMLCACGETEPKYKHEDKGKTEKTEPKKDDDNKTEGNKNEAGGDKEDNKPELSQDELNAYLGGLNSSWSVAKVREVIKQIGEVKDINGKSIKITAVQLMNEKPEEGTFTLRVTAEVAGKLVERSFDYTGFAKRPNNYRYVKSMQADWRVAQEVYTKEFALDKLAEDNNQAYFTSEYLTRFVEFKTSDFDGKVYVLSQEEAKALKIVDIAYRGGRITFKVEHKGATSDRDLVLTLDAMQYYTNKFSENKDNAAKYYAEGVAKNPDMYLAQVLNYDTERYYHEGLSAQSSSAGEEVIFSFKLLRRGTDKELATIVKTVQGFRPLSTLAKEMMIVGNYDLHKELGRLTGDLKGGTFLVSKLNRTIDNWIKLATIKVGNTELAWEEESEERNSIIPILRAGGKMSELHLYFKNPRIRVTDAYVDGNRLHVKFKIEQINGAGFSNLKLETESNFHLIRE